MYVLLFFVDPIEDILSGGPLTREPAKTVSGLRGQPHGTTLTCTTATPYPLPRPATLGQPSPDCGHTYTRASLPKGTYTITATAHWQVHWAGLGHTGTLPTTTTATRTLGVGELQAVVVTPTGG